MAPAERRVFSYPKYQLRETLDLLPRHNTEQGFRNILKKCIGTDTNLFIQSDSGSFFMHQRAFMRAKGFSPEDQEKFIALTVQAMKEAERVVIQTPALKFSQN